MEMLVIHGGRRLNGSVEIGGAKNAVLPLLAATVVRGGRYVLRSCPVITDVELASEIIRELGGQVERSGRTLRIDTTEVNRWQIPQRLMARMRASVLFLGALLARFGRAELTPPGGCPLGRRPIDLHLEAMTRMGASITMEDGSIRCSAPKLHGCVVELAYPSVGATENVLLAAMGCKGTVVLQGAAKEPEVGDLIGFLRELGAEISGAGTDTLMICSGTDLEHSEHTVLPDRMETATLLCAAAACGGRITLTNTNGSLLLPVLLALEQAGCGLKLQEDRITLWADGLQAVPLIETAPYPGFPTDAQAPIMAALLRARGDSRILECVFDSRFGHVPQLCRFGAQVETAGSAAMVRGVETLRPAQVEGGDLRAAAAMVIAALQAEGKSVVTGLKHLDRGYDDLEGKLRSLGADIFRETGSCVDSDWKFPGR